MVKIVTPGCTATLSLTAGTGDPCSVSATISATGCDGKSYQVKEGSTSKCPLSPGTISGASASCSFTQSAAGSHSYDLYVDSAKKDTESATCGAPSVECKEPSGWNTKSACESNGCKWCSFGSKCLFSQDYCLSSGGYDCAAQTSESFCNSQLGRCAWCKNSYSGSANANGGTCMKSEDLASSCGS